MKELAITLDTEKKQPLYEQIYEALREAILQGRILQGEKLPSTRFEAEYLQVSRSTVNSLMISWYLRVIFTRNRIAVILPVMCGNYII